MILRRFMLHFQKQNWFAVGLDVIVVIVGVYLGVILGEYSSSRALKVEVDDALEVVRVQLEEELKNVDYIIQYRKDKLLEPDQGLELISQPEFDGQELSLLLEQTFSRMFTFFPKTSGYSSMKDRGFLSKINSPHLLSSLAYLYDQVYVRHVVVADESDQNTFHYQRNVIGAHWNLYNHSYIGDSKVAHARIQNSFIRVKRYSSWYVIYLTETVRPALVSALDEIAQYQQ